MHRISFKRKHNIIIAIVLNWRVYFTNEQSCSEKKLSQQHRSMWLDIKSRQHQMVHHAVGSIRKSTSLGRSHKYRAVSNQSTCTKYFPLWRAHRTKSILPECMARICVTEASTSRQHLAPSCSATCQNGRQPRQLGGTPVNATTHPLKISLLNSFSIIWKLAEAFGIFCSWCHR